MAADCIIRPAKEDDRSAAYHVCLKTGDHGADGTALYEDDPDALGRIFVGPYLAFEPDLSLVLEDAQGICGYALAAFDTRAFYDRYEKEWRPDLCRRHPAPQGDPRYWSAVQLVYHWYHCPDYFCPEPYDEYPSHLHIDLLERAQGHGHGRRMIDRLIDTLRRRGSPGVHLGLSAFNRRAYGFYDRIGFRELVRVGTSRSDAVIYMGMTLSR